MTRPHDLYRRFDGEHSLGSKYGDVGIFSQTEAEKDAAQGSRALANHCHRAIDRFAQQYGIAADEAKILLLDTGIRL